MAKQWFHRLMLLFVLVALPACGLNRILRESTPTPAPPAVVQVTADQIAQAMQADEFFSDFRQNLLRVDGEVHSITPQEGGFRIELETSLHTKVICVLDTQATTIQPGDRVTVEALAADAERGQSAVLLKKCHLPK